MHPRLAPPSSVTLSLSLVLAACGGGGDHPPDAAGPGTPDAPPATVDSDPGAVPRIEPAACRFDVDPSLGLVEGVGYRCGDLVVAEDRAAPDREIRLHFIQVTSAVATHNATIYLDGGPGGDGQGILDYAAYLGPTFLAGLLVDGDFLVISQRGTARSVPFLDCVEVDCSDFAATADLTMYNTAANADDVDDLRAALGLEQLDLYGISYGSRLGLEVLRRHGDHVRAAVIEGLVPAQVIWPAAIPASFYGALSALDDSCAHDHNCGAAFGDLVGGFLTAVDVLNANPVSIDVGGSDVPLDGYSLAYLMFQMMYSSSSYPWLPLMVHDLGVRRTDRVQPFLSAWLSLGEGDEGGGISSGLYYGVVCGEQFNPPTPGAFEAANVGVPEAFVEIFGGSYYGLIDVCSTWPVGNLQAELAQPVTSSVRTLVSSGRLDPITPPGFGDIAAATLTNSVVVVHEDSGHGATLQSACGTENLFDFLADPTTPHDTSCAASIATDYIIPSSLAARSIPLARIRAERALAPVPPFIRERVRRITAM